MNEFVSDASTTAPQKETDQPVGVRAEEPIRYLDAYQFIFRSPNAASNIMLLTVCQLIPIVGPMVLYGYQFEIVDSLSRAPQADYPRFDFNRFTEYLKRGVWPFLVYLLLNLVMAPVIVGMQLVFVFGGAALTHSGESGGGEDPIASVLAILGFGLFFFVVMALSFGMMFLMTPLTIAAGLSQDLGESLRFSWFKSFIGKVWKEQLLSQLFLAVTAPLLLFLGFLLCCIGMYPAITIVMLAQAHFYFQLYQLFLARGGAPVPQKAL